MTEKPLNKYQQKIVDRILERRAEGLGIDYGAVKRDEGGLISIADHHFGSGGYKKALAAAGFDWRTLRNEAYAKRKRERH
ncbi:MAG: hypothetical protein AB1626_04965, partial [Candidatus Micrarchaeota archaeon]